MLTWLSMVAPHRLAEGGAIPLLFFSHIKSYLHITGNLHFKSKHSLLFCYLEYLLSKIAFLIFCWMSWIFIFYFGFHLTMKIIGWHECVAWYKVIDIDFVYGHFGWIHNAQKNWWSTSSNWHNYPTTGWHMMYFSIPQVENEKYVC